MLYVNEENTGQYFGLLKEVMMTLDLVDIQNAYITWMKLEYLLIFGPLS